MRKTILTLIGVLALSFASFSQDRAKEIFNIITGCGDCGEVVMITGALEKRYTGDWFDSVKEENGFLVFQKGAAIHYWDASKVVFIEETSRFIRVYLEQAR
ncbi:MAG: hypothetical protein QNK23_17760 [Crocinitomicaceae bacterium]|nr:hypothetical protein [Crocinitomicaceae bacterium]